MTYLQFCLGAGILLVGIAIGVILALWVVERALR